MKPFHDRPCASPGLLSYRYRGRYGFVMIGATDDDDALREAGRSMAPRLPDLARLERWNGESYIAV
jgi:hypothetical protein